MNRTLITALIVLTLASCGLGYGLYQTSKALGATTLQVASLEARLEAAEARIGRIQTQVKTTLAKAQEARYDLNHAVQAAPDAAARATPPAVVDSLCKSLRCRPADPVRASSR